MTRCDTCDAQFGDCTCDEDKPLGVRYRETDRWVWNINDLVNMPETEEREDE